MHSMVTGLASSARREKLAVAGLIAAAAVWGATFVVVKSAIAETGVEEFLVWRFLIAAASLAALRPRSLGRLGLKGWAHGAILGSALALGYQLQTLGLRSTPAAVSGFLTGLEVVFAPLLAWALLGQRPSRRLWAATVLATAGLALISLRGFRLSAGELLTLASAAAFAFQIVGLGRWSRTDDTSALATVQLLSVAGVSLLIALWAGRFALPHGGQAWGAIAGTAVVATALAFVAQSWAQSQLSPAQTAVVLTLEPLFAAIVAWGAGEGFGWPLLGGGALVIAAMLTIEAPAHFWQPRRLKVTDKASEGVQQPRWHKVTPSRALSAGPVTTSPAMPMTRANGAVPARASTLSGAMPAKERSSS